MAARAHGKRAGSGKIRPTAIALYGGLFVLIVSVVAAGYKAPRSSEGELARTAATTTQEVSSQPVSVGEVVATTLAANVAEAVALPVASNVANLSVSLAAKNDLTGTADTSVSVGRQQIVQPQADSREVVAYKTVAGDTVDKLASDYGVSKDTIKWANNLTSDALEPGKDMIIPPVDGVVHTVKDGDTVQALAEKYKASADRVVAFNDLELGGLKNGTKIVIPAGQLPETERPGYVAPRTFTTTRTTSGGGGNFMSGSVGNRYAYGYCTWYAYERRAQMGRPVGSFWGNANTWAAAARAQGFTVSRTPVAGAVLQTSYGGGGYGHVGIIESVDHEAGTVTYSDMNGIAGWNRIGRATVSIAEAQARWTFIY